MIKQNRFFPLLDGLIEVNATTKKKPGYIKVAVPDELIQQLMKRMMNQEMSISNITIGYQDLLHDDYEPCRDTKDKIEELELKLSEHKRLHAQLNTILHPDDGAPENPSLCDLVAFVELDRRELKAKLDVYEKSATQYVAKQIKE